MKVVFLDTSFLFSLHNTIDYISPFIFQKAQGYYEKYKDKDWSFVDFTTYAYMREKGISTIASIGHRHINEFAFEVIP